MSTIEFSEAVLSLESNLKNFAFTFTRNEEDAKDLTQETLLKAFHYRTYYTPQTNFKAWIFTIMRNLFINQYRRLSKSKTIFDDSKEKYLLNNYADSAEDAAQVMLRSELDKQFNKLESTYREPFEMHFNGFKYKEIAEQLEIPIGTVKSRIFIARQRLMELLPEYQYS